MFCWIALLFFEQCQLRQQMLLQFVCNGLVVRFVIERSLVRLLAGLLLSNNSRQVVHTYDGILTDICKFPTQKFCMLRISTLSQIFPKWWVFNTKFCFFKQKKNGQ